MPPGRFTFLLLSISILTAGRAPCLHAQDSEIVLEEHEAFFAGIPAPYRAWLSETGLAPIIGMDTVGIQNDLLVFRFTIPDKANWLYLDSVLLASGGRDLAAELFDRAQLLSDLPAPLIRLKLDGKDALLTIELNPDGTQLDVYFADKMGQVSDNILLPIKQLRFAGTAASEKNVDWQAPQLKSRIQDGLTLFFKSRNQSWFQESRLEVVANYRPDAFVLRVTNIKGVVLDLNYFEYLRLSFQFSAAAEGYLKVTYSVDGKYGAGILWAPFESEYHPMSPEFDPALTQFASEILKTEIAKLLTP